MLCDDCLHAAICENTTQGNCDWYLSEKELKEKWIPVSERLPAYSGLYLISIGDLVSVANFTGTYFSNRGGVRIEVSAWQSLPEPYQEAT